MLLCLLCLLCTFCGKCTLRALVPESVLDHLFFIIFIIFIMTIVAFACTTFSSHAHGLAAGLSFWLRIAENTHFHNGFCRFHGFSWGPDQSMPGPRNWFIFYYIYYIYYRHHCIPVLVLTPPAESRKIPFIFLLYLLWFIIFIIFIIFILYLNLYGHTQRRMTA